MFVPLTLAAIGIVLRGASFAFRKAVLRTNSRRNFGAAFAISSVVVPYCFGSVIGDRVRARPSGGRAGDPVSSWINPSSILAGVLAVVVASYLAATLPRLGCAPAVGRRHGHVCFRRRAVGAAIVAGIAAFAGIFVLRADARYVFDGLTSRALPLVVVSVLAGAAALVWLVRGARRGTQALAAGAVAAMVAAWGVAQWDCSPRASPSSRAAPSGTIARRCWWPWRWRRS